MEPNTAYSASSSELAVIQKKLLLDGRVRNGANWFFWIAGLSLLNSAIYVSGNKWTFVIGLATTQLIDGFMNGLTRSLGSSWAVFRVIGLVIDLCIAGAFVLLGYFVRKRIRWPIMTGLILYSIDGLITLSFQDWFSA